jgi:acyl-CoA thioesterase II
MLENQRPIDLARHWCGRDGILTIGVSPMTHCFSDLVPIERIGIDRFLVTPPGSGFLFGGLSMAAVLRAAAETIEPDKVPMSLHATFFAAGDWGGPHDLTVQRVNDTRTFAMRRIEMVTGGRLTAVAEAVFHHPEGGDDWQAARLPDLPQPETLERFDDRLPAQAIDLRPVSPASGFSERIHPYWCRPIEALDDPILLACALAYASDYMVIATPFPAGSGAAEGLVSRTWSHTLTFHRPLFGDPWWLFDCGAISVSRGRFSSSGTVQSDAGELLASFVQQGYIRPVR